MDPTQTQANSRFSWYRTGLSVPRGSLLVPYGSLRVPYGSYSRKLKKLTKTWFSSYLSGLSIAHGSLLVPFGSNSRKLTISKLITCCSFSKFILCAGSSIINHIITAHVGVWMGSRALLGRHPPSYFQAPKTLKGGLSELFPIVLLGA
jgi:hypothetical protein